MKTNILNYTENSYIYRGKTTTTMKKLIILLMALTVLLNTVSLLNLAPESKA